MRFERNVLELNTFVVWSKTVEGIVFDLIIFVDSSEEWKIVEGFYVNWLYL